MPRYIRLPIPFPLPSYSSYEYLSKFRLCRWIYQNGKVKTPNSLSEMHVPEKIITAHKKLSEGLRKPKKTFFIWDSNVFQSFVKEIKYFAGLNLISTSDMMYLKNELQQLLIDLEHLSVKGEYGEGHELFIYLSNIDFEATYTYVSNGISKSAFSGYIPSTPWIRKVRKSAKYKRTGYNR